MELSREKTLPQLASEYECTACLACENVCPKQAIDHYFAQDGHVYVKVDRKSCIGCLKCQQVCEKSRSYYGENNLLASKLYAAWTNNVKDRAFATSGGVFAALARTILESGGCVIGAELEGFNCKHTVIYSSDDIHRLQGSKYMASSMEAVYTIISEELPNRDVLFSGVGCQCAGVLAFFERFKTNYKLYTVDLVCGGIPSRVIIDKFIANYPEVTGLSSFRSKEKYELKVTTQHGCKTIMEKSLPLHGFNCGLTNRYCCYECKFAKIHRCTDLTIGDLWDKSILRDEHAKGISMILIHSSNGQNIVHDSDLSINSIEWEGPLLHNKRILCGHQNIYYPRRKLTYLLDHMSYNRFKKLFTMTMRATDVDLLIFRVYRYVRERLLTRRNQHMIKQILKFYGQ